MTPEHIQKVVEMLRVHATVLNACADAMDGPAVAELLAKPLYVDAISKLVDLLTSGHAAMREVLPALEGAAATNVAMEKARTCPRSPPR